MGLVPCSSLAEVNILVRSPGIMQVCNSYDSLCQDTLYGDGEIDLTHKSTHSKENYSNHKSNNSLYTICNKKAKRLSRLRQVLRVTRVILGL